MYGSTVPTGRTPAIRRPDHRAAFVRSCLGSAAAGAAAGAGEATGDATDWFDALDTCLDRTVEPEAAGVDRTSGHPARAVEALRALGAFGVQIPREHGGLGFGDGAAALVVERTARACPSTAAILMFHFQVVRRTLDHAHPARRTDDLASMAAGTTIAASAWTEPAASRDKTDVRTTMTRGPDGPRVDGAKTYCTGLESATCVDVLLAVEDGEGGGERRPTFVRVDTKRAGVRIAEIYPMLGLRGTGTGTVELTAVPVDDGDVLGEVGSAPALMSANHRTPLNPGLLALGIADAALRAALRMTTGDADGTPRRPPDDLLRRAVAESSLACESAYVYAADVVRRMADDPDRAFVLGSRLKAHATAAAETVTSRLMRASGSRGFLATHPLERHFRDAQATSLMGPPNEACLQRIATDLLPDPTATKR